jgi:alkylhydroperoxidase family enzyme
VSDGGGPRVAPGTRKEIGVVNAAIAWIAGRVAGTGPLNLFTTLGRHRKLFRGWLFFAGRLMPRGTLRRADTELVILRVAHNCACEYEWRHHERIAQKIGLTGAEVARVRTGAAASGWTPRQGALLRAADELHDRRELSEELWTELSRELREPQLIELCMLVGHYEMLAMTLRSLRVQPEN